MIDSEREESEDRRRLIWEQNRTMNRPRPNRVIPAADRNQEILGNVGLWRAPDKEIDWRELTRDG